MRRTRDSVTFDSDLQNENGFEIWKQYFFLYGTVAIILQLIYVEEKEMD